MERRTDELFLKDFPFVLMMGRTRLEQIEDIYQAVIDQPKARRSSFLDDSCGEDDELRREVESLLRYEDASSNFMDSPPALLAAEMLAQEDEKHTLVDGQIRHYRIERLLGEGGMGEVYLAEDTRLHRRVALKVLPQSIVGDAERLMRFEREAQAASALNHPNILTVHEFGEDKGVHFIASEFVEGLTLRHRLVAGRLETVEALEIAIQVSSALSAAHESGITHRDIKPENIMVRRDGYIKVLDFGLAKLTQKQSPSTSAGSEDPTQALLRTKPGAVMGTAAYMSPEQVRGRHVDARTDIWSLGAVIYEMVTGRRPFSGETQADTFVSVLSSEPAPLSSYVHDLPAELEWIVSKALTKNVDSRYQTSKELRADLDRIKKRIEFDENLRRSAAGKSQNDGAQDEEIPSIVGQAVPTAGDAAGPTSGGQDEWPGARSFWSSPSIAVAFRQAHSHKVGSLIVTLVLFAIISYAVFLVFFDRLARAQIFSIAVLPFDNLSGNPDL
ncbi:MAG: serine/threonine-protein kinase, partial [Blastocatellia bacterium]